MAPFLRAGDRVGVEWFAEGVSPLGVGDVVVARAETDDWVVHRVIVEGGRQKFTDEIRDEFKDRSGERICLKGDRSSSFESLAAERIFGRVVSVRIGRRNHTYRRTRLDGWIAHVSRLTLSPSRAVAFLARRGTRALGRTRRAWLKVTSS